MYYELYIDAFFLVNTIMNFFILLVIKRILRCTATRLNILIGSVVGSLLTCLLIVLPVKGIFLKLLLIHCGANFITAMISLKIKRFCQLMKAVVLLYFITFLFGGILQWCTEITSTPLNVIKLVILGACCYGIISVSIHFFQYYKKKDSSLVAVTIMKDGSKKELIGLIDTGNSLLEPVTGKPVNIISLELVKGFLSNEVMKYLESFYRNEIHHNETPTFEELGTIFYIPFHSVGKKSGVMPALTFDMMLMKKENENILIKSPIFAICENSFVSKDRYQIILNPKLSDH